VKINGPGEVEAAWKQLGGRLGVLEGFVRFEKEISVIGARGFDGVFYYYPTFENEHRNRILDVTTYPAAISDRVDSRAANVATGIAEALDLIGVMCVEMFVVGDDVIVNELAPRPHNSGHLTFDFAVSSQFEQQLRAVCGLPIGACAITWESGVAMANLLGDLWQGGEPNWEAALRQPDVKLHLYGKSQAAPGRKMGHLATVGASPEEARQRVVAARAALITRA
jgi:5-(carboxyamino)imidazole ribonucleotide synthase